MSKNLADASNEWTFDTAKLADLDFSIVKDMRDGQDEEAIESYLRDWSQLPPIDVFFDGKTYWVVDGGHRGAAGELGNKKTIKCRIKNGTRREAELEAMGRNEDHGVRRTNEEKRKIIEKLLNDPEWGKRSQRWIAEHARVHPKTVRAVRDEIFGSSDHEPGTNDAQASGSGEISSTPDPGAESSKVEGKDGKAYPARQPIPKAGKRKSKGAKMGFETQRGSTVAPDADGFGAPPDTELEQCPGCGAMVKSIADCQCLAADLEDEDDSGTGATAPTGDPAAPDDGPLPGKPAPAPTVETPRVRVPVRVDLAEFEIAALHCVTEPDPTLHAELFDDWENTEGHGECPEADARAAVLKLGVRFE